MVCAEVSNPLCAGFPIGREHPCPKWQCFKDQQSSLDNAADVLLAAENANLPGGSPLLCSLILRFAYPK